MPKIEVYKSGNSVIPVADAKVTKAYICPWTKKIHINRKKYIEHLGQYRKNQIYRTIQVNNWKKKAEELWNQPSFDHIIAWCAKNPYFFLDRAMQSCFADRKKAFDKIHKEGFSFRITFLELYWRDDCSNTHSCPHNGVTNFSSVDTKPVGYPGWSGRIKFEASHDFPTFFSDMFRGTRIHTGTGGGNGFKYSCEVKFFDDDWPGLSGPHHTLSLLKGERKRSFKYREGS